MNTRNVAAVVAGITLALAAVVGVTAKMAAGPAGKDSSTARPVEKHQTFFHAITQDSVTLKLAPDAWVRNHTTDYTPPPPADIEVVLPVYPGATSTRKASAIGDMGTPMTSDLVSAEAYYQSIASPKTIEQWYAAKLATFGYVTGGRGSSNAGGVRSTFYSFNKKGTMGDPTSAPEIDLGFITTNGHTMFKLRATFIDLPQRKSDSILPDDVVRVVLRQGKNVHTVTDGTWIHHVVTAINGLQPDPPGTRSCPTTAMVPGQAPPNPLPDTIHAEFIEQDGTKIPVVFSMPCGVRDVTVGNSQLALWGSRQIDQWVDDAFQGKVGAS